MKVGDLMTRKVATMLVGGSVLEAARIMESQDVGSVLILDGTGKYLGLVSSRAIIRCVVAPSLDPEEVSVEDIMRTDLVPARESDDVQTAARYIQELRVRRLPVADADGNLTGVISVSDIARFIRNYIDCIFAEADERVSRRDKA